MDTTSSNGLGGARESTLDGATAEGSPDLQKIFTQPLYYSLSVDSLTYAGIHLAARAVSISGHKRTNKQPKPTSKKKPTKCILFFFCSAHYLVVLTMDDESTGAKPVTFRARARKYTEVLPFR